MTNHRLPQLDALRGIAILSVMVLHYGSVLPFAEPHTALSYLEHVLSFGWMGVDLFFVLSGFLIGQILIANKSCTASNYFGTFYVRRLLRIVPLYAVALLVGVATARSARMNAIPGPGTQISWLWYLTFTQNIETAISGAVPWFGQSWSLAVEEQFYLLMPLAVWLIPNKRLIWFVVPLIGAAFAVRCLLFSINASAWAIYVLLPTRMDQLLVGVLIAWALETRPLILQSNMAIIRATAILCAVMVLAFVAFSWGWGSSMIAVGYTAIATVCGGLIAVVVTPGGGGFTRTLGSKPLRWIGTRAYFLYIFHWVIPFSIFALAAQYTDNLLLICGICAITLFGGAELSWRAFEKPLIDFGHRFRYDLALARTSARSR